MKKKNNQDIRYWYDKFWELYDKNRVELSSTFYNRLIIKNPYHYTWYTFRHQCIQIEWFYNNCNTYKAEKCSLHGDYLEMYNSSTERLYRVKFGLKKGLYTAIWILDYNGDLSELEI